jgi:hypothetical protein
MQLDSRCCPNGVGDRGLGARCTATERHPAAELGAGEIQVIAKGPQQRHRWIDVERAVDR